MNKHILFVMRSLDNPELFTQEEKEANIKSSLTAAVAAAVAAADAAVAAADAADAAAAYTDDAAAAYADEGDAEYWINEFFERSGEDKQTYIDEINKMLGE